MAKKKTQKKKIQKAETPKKKKSITLDAFKGSQVHIAYLELQNVESLLAALELQKTQLEAEHKQKVETFRKLTAEFQLPLRFNFIRNDDDTYTVSELPPQPPQPQLDSL